MNIGPTASLTTILSRTNFVAPYLFLADDRSGDMNLYTVPDLNIGRNK
jgi:hypothetical protein